MFLLRGSVFNMPWGVQWIIVALVFGCVHSNKCESARTTTDGGVSDDSRANGASDFSAISRSITFDVV